MSLLMWAYQIGGPLVIGVAGVVLLYGIRREGKGG